MTTQTDLARPVDVDDEPRRPARGTRAGVATATAGVLLAAALFGGGFVVGRAVAADGGTTVPQQSPLGQHGQVPTPPDGFGAPTAPDGAGTGGTGTDDTGTSGSSGTDVA